MRYHWFLIALLLLALPELSLCQSWVSSTSPAPNSQNTNSSTEIIVTFNRAVDPLSLNPASVKVTGTFSGVYPVSSVQYNSAAKQATIILSRPSMPGEAIAVVLTSAIKETPGGTAMPSYQFGFSTASQGGTSAFRDSTTIAVGGSAEYVTSGDLDGDGDMDLVICDNGLKLLLNDGKGHFPTSVSVNPQYKGLAAAILDLDRDGDADLVSLDTWGSISFLWNGGHLNFTETTYNLGQHDYYIRSTYTLATADLNNDGLPDLIVPNGNSGPDNIWTTNTYVLLNMGGGSWNFKLITEGGGAFPFCAPGDVDGDGDVDLVINNMWNGSFTHSVLKNDGSGNFTRSALMTDGYSTRSMLLMDADNNGSLDLVMALSGDGTGGTPTVAIMKNNGSGEFTKFSSAGTGQFPMSLKATDLDGDGRQELVTGNYSSNDVSVFKNNGQGNFTETRKLPTSGIVTSIAVNDFDGDANPDLAVLNWSPHALNLFWGTPVYVQPLELAFGSVWPGQSSTRSFTIYNNDPTHTAQIESLVSSDTAFQVAPASASIPPRDSLLVSVTFQHARRQLYSEYVTVTATAPDSQVFRVNLSGDLYSITSVSPSPNAQAVDTNAAVSVALLFPVRPSDLAVGAVRVIGSKSGRMEGSFVLPSTTSDTLTFIPGKPFRPGEIVSVTLTTAVRGPGGDSLAKPYVWNFVTETADGTGRFTAPKAVAAGGMLSDLVSGDFNGDGTDDIALGVATSDLRILISDGAGSFVTVQDCNVPVGSGSFAAGDIDNDGDIDLVLFSLQKIHRLQNDGTGHFTPLPTLDAAPLNPKNLSIGDLNGDGWLDCVIADQWMSYVCVFLNDRQGGFLPLASYPSGPYTMVSALGDLDGDGDLDIVAGNFNQSVTILTNNGQGVFVTGQTIPIFGIPSSFALTDVDRDGRLDIAVATNGSGSRTMAVCLNHDSLSFSVVPIGVSGKEGGQIIAEDVDSDGDPDLLVQSAIEDSVYLFLNSHGEFLPGGKTLVGSPARKFTMGEYDYNGSPDYALLGAEPTYPLLRASNRSVDPEIAVDSTTLDFGLVAIGGRKTHYLKVTNEGGRNPLAIVLISPDSGLINVPTDSMHLGPEEMTSVPVILMADSAAFILDSLLVRSNDPKLPVLTIRVKGIPSAPPAPPLLTSPGDSAEQLSVPVRLQWQHSGGATRYHLQVFQDSVGGNPFIDASMFPDTSMSPSILHHETRYWWRVATFDQALGEGPFSAPFTFTTFRDGPAGLTASLKDSESAMLEWGRQTDPRLERYYIYRGTDRSSLSLLDSTTSADDTTYAASGMEPGLWYYFNVTSIDSSGFLSDTSSMCKAAQPLFAPMQLSFSRLRDAAGRWGDFDNDNDLDLLVCGTDSTGRSATEVYRNDREVLTLVLSVLTKATIPAAEWGDFDRDGYLDFFTSREGSSGPFTSLYRNDQQGGFTLTDVKLPGAYPSWVDVDNDGDLDILHGDANSTLYRNDGRGNSANEWLFTPNPSPGSYLTWKSFADYNRDGLQDFISVGTSGPRLYRGATSGTFIQAGSFSPSITRGKGVWGDFDSDGSIDLCLIGAAVTPERIRIHYATSNSTGNVTFVTLYPSYSLFSEGTIAAADIDADGSLDLYASGRSISSQGAIIDSTTTILRCLGTFPVARYGDRFPWLPGSSMTNAAFADMNGDGKVEAFVGPSLSSPGLFRNRGVMANSAPQAPSRLHARFSADTLIMSWNRGSDANQPGQKALGMSYNVYVDSIDGRMLLPANADQQSGFRRIAEMGNASQDTCWRIIVPAPGKYVWSVQTIDCGFAGSLFAPPDTISGGSKTGIDERGEIASTFVLEQNYPNPFNPRTVIRSSVPPQAGRDLVSTGGRDGQTPEVSNVRIVIYDLLGREVKVLVNERRAAGLYEDVFDGSGLASGVYVYRLTAGSFVQSRKMVLLK